jgi:hypothetical protein
MFEQTVTRVLSRVCLIPLFQASSGIYKRLGRTQAS